MAATDEVEGFYRECYDVVFSDGVGRAVVIAHRQMERGVRASFPQVLEVGAGSGQHRPFVRHPFDLYVETDLRPQARQDDDDRRVRREQADACALPYQDATFDRVIATCLLIHLADPERALAEWRRVLRPGGLISIYVPCDPGLVLRAVRAATTARKVARLGYDDYPLLIAREHHQQAGGLDIRIRHCFRDDDVAVTWWPLRLRSWNLNLFAVYQVTTRR